MRPGNVPQTVWRRSVLKQVHTEEEESLLKVSEAEMCTAVPLKSDKETIVLTADAFSCGNTAFIGYSAAAKAVNDLMTRGGEAQSVRVRIFLPVSANETDVRGIVREIRSLCDGQHISFGGIRVDTIPSLSQRLVQVTAMGTVEKSGLLHLEQVSAGQEIILCGSLALEGMQQILEEREEELRSRFVPAFLRQMKGLKAEVVQSEAIRAVRGYVSAMQQIGSGGILAALWETAEAAGIGLRVDMSRMTVCQETIEVCEFYRLNPYQMTSAGAVLMFTDEGERVLGILRGCGARAIRLGIATAENARVITSGEETRFLDRPAPDELALWQEKRLGSGNTGMIQEREAQQFR